MTSSATNQSNQLKQLPKIKQIHGISSSSAIPSLDEIKISSTNKMEMFIEGWKRGRIANIRATPEYSAKVKADEELT